jgi:protein-S-isoprenylcysteine O-methyltransferase Ste14
MIPIGIVFNRLILTIWDIIIVLIGAALVFLFAYTLIKTHRIKQMHMKPDDVDKIITEDIFSIIRHPNYLGLICMNFAMLCFFRTILLIPIAAVFIVLWYLNAKHEEMVLISKFGETYSNYKIETAMFMPRLTKAREK